jgi:hypothetical protein
LTIENESLDMVTKDLFTVDGFDRNIFKIKMTDNDEKMIILSENKLIFKNLQT